MDGGDAADDEDVVGTCVDRLLDFPVGRMDAFGEDGLFSQRPRLSDEIRGAAPARIGVDRYDVADLYRYGEDLVPRLVGSESEGRSGFDLGDYLDVLVHMTMILQLDLGPVLW
jgi:hypothetical protein